MKDGKRKALAGDPLGAFKDAEMTSGSSSLRIVLRKERNALIFFFFLSELYAER